MDKGSQARKEGQWGSWGQAPQPLENRAQERQGRSLRANKTGRLTGEDLESLLAKPAFQHNSLSPPHSVTNRTCKAPSACGAPVTKAEVTTEARPTGHRIFVKHTFAELPPAARRPLVQGGPRLLDRRSQHLRGL